MSQLQAWTPQTRSLVWQVVGSFAGKRDNGIPHHPLHGEVADADYVVILDKGKIAAEGTRSS